MAEGLKIEVRNLYKIFGANPGAFIDAVKAGMSKTELNEQHGHVLGLKDINIDMPAGGIQVVMGLSGSGKSTLIRHINRLIDPTAGEILVGGDDVTRMNAAQLREFRRHKTAMVFQKFALLPHRTVLENTVYGLEIQGVPRDKQELEARRWIDRVGLSGFESHYPNQLSGGMQQRASIVRSLSVDPSVLLMDEPFGALDAFTRDEMNLLIQEIWMETGKTIAFVTHSIAEAIFLADRVAVMSARPGRIAEIYDVDIPRPRAIDIQTQPDFIERVLHIKSRIEHGRGAAAGFAIA